TVEGSCVSRRWSRRSSAPGSPPCSSYEGRRARVQRFAAPVLAVVFALTGASSLAETERTVRVVALGDSLTAGLGLPADAAFPAKLERALRAAGRDAEAVNAGVPGGTASRGLPRPDWSRPEGTDAVIVDLGANDMRMGIAPAVPCRALAGIVRRLSERHTPVLLAGMRAAANPGAEYGRAFEAISSDLAAQTNLFLYPFFLDGVAAETALM